MKNLFGLFSGSHFFWCQRIGPDKPVLNTTCSCEYTGRIISMSICIFVCIAEILVGKIFGNISLTADGWHVGIDALILGGGVVTIILKSYTRVLEKVFSVINALLLAGIGVYIIGNVYTRYVSPVVVNYDSIVLIVAICGLLLNGLQIIILAKTSGGGILGITLLYHVIGDGIQSVLVILSLIFGRSQAFIVDQILATMIATTFLIAGFVVLKEIIFGETSGHDHHH